MEATHVKNHAPDGTIVTVQYLRAVAACLIVFHHAMAPPALKSYYPHSFGEFGVDLFFVISGFIMWTTTVRGRRGPASFWAARIVRIVPLYWVYTTLFLAAALIVPHALFTSPGLDAVFILKSYLFVPAVHPTFGGVAPVYTLGWTLNFEMFFYLIFGVGLLVARPAGRMIFLAAVFFLLASIGWLATPQGPILATYTNPILLEFFAGVVLAALAPRLMRSSAISGMILIALAVSWVVHVVLSDTPPNRLVAYGMPAAIIVAGALILEPIARPAANRFGLLLGDASYSIYLAHPFAQRTWFFAVGALLPDIGTPAGAVAYVGGAMLAGILGGVLSYLLLERPLLAAGHRLIGRRALSRRTTAMESRP
jgi:exopolysaccharide production protein ExoZ